MQLESLLAYIDPMSGTIVLQVIVAAVIGCFALFRKTIVGAFSWVTGRRAKPAQPEGEDHATEQRKKAA